MSQESQATNNRWLTIVTLRISFQKSTFSPSFRDKLKVSTGQRLLCSCPQLSDLNPGFNAKYVVRGLLPSDHFTARFIISGSEKVKHAKRICTPKANQQFDDAKEFSFWIRSLAIQLSELCESDHTRDHRSEERNFGIRAFKNDNPTNRSVCEDLERLLNNPLSPSEQEGHGMGYVYVLRSQMGPTTMKFLKIGFSKFHPEHRAHELARCLAKPEVVSHTPLIPHAKRLESIIHTELQSCRKIQSCLRCYKDHQEWFAVSHPESREILTRWSAWILQQPYVDGKLTDEWKNHLRTNDCKSIGDSTSVAAFWKTLINDFPQIGSSDNRSQRVGKYLIDCHWDVLCGELGATYHGKDFCNSLRGDVPTRGSAPGSWRENSQASFDDVEQELCDLQMRDDCREDRYQMNGHDAIANLPAADAFHSDDSDTGSIYSDTPISAAFRKDKLLSRTLNMFHPETKVRHLFNHDKSPGPLLRLLQSQETELEIAIEDMIKIFESIRTAETCKTGALSVSDPVLGATESPLGDATMLPVLTIKDLKHLTPLVANWIGMSPTNIGFQYVQEAYAKGQWFGRKPRFQLPKAYRRAGYKTLSSKKRGKEKAKDLGTTSEPPADNASPDQTDDRPSFQLTRGPESDMFTWRFPMDDDFIEKVEQGIEEIQNGGRANVEKRLKRALRHVGANLAFGQDGDSESSVSSDSFVSLDCSASESEGQDLRAAPSSETLPITSLKRRKDSSKSTDLVSAKKAKLWLQSL